MSTKNIEETLINLDKNQLTDYLNSFSLSSLMSCINSTDKYAKKFEAEVGNTINISESMRQESTVIAMRDFHNWIKRELITNIKNKLVLDNNGADYISLMDIACGRGGDIDKWNRSGIKSVFAFDKNEDSIESTDKTNPGAKARLKEYKNLRTKIHFEVADVTVPTEELLESIESFRKKNGINKGFDIVSCQFALHYFFESLESLDIVLRLVSKYLRPGGYFIGTFVDSLKIREKFNSLTGKEKVYTNSLLRLERVYTNKRTTEKFGNEYKFTINDRYDKTNYFNTTGVSTEYLADSKTLIDLARNYSLFPSNVNFLHPIHHTPGAYHNLKREGIIPFEDIFKLGVWTPKQGSPDITLEELEISFLNSCFILQKQEVYQPSPKQRTRK